MKKIVALILTAFMLAVIIGTFPMSVSADMSAPVITGDPNDIVAKVYIEGTSTPYAEIKRSEFTEKFKNGDKTANILASDPELCFNNVKLEILADIDVGEDLIGFYVRHDRTLTVNGKNHVITGSNKDNPFLRVHNNGDMSGGVVNINRLNLYSDSTMCFKYYGDLTVNVGQCKWTSKTGSVICPTGTGSSARLNLNDGTVIQSGGIAIDAAGTGGNTINIAQGAKVISTGSEAICVRTLGVICVYGEIICQNGDAINYTVNTGEGPGLVVDGGKITGNVHFTDSVYLDLQRGSITGALESESNDFSKVFIESGFVINTLSTTAPESTNTPTPESDGTTSAKNETEEMQTTEDNSVPVENTEPENSNVENTEPEASTPENESGESIQIIENESVTDSEPSGQHIVTYPQDENDTSENAGGDKTVGCTNFNIDFSSITLVIITMAAVIIKKK